MCLPVAEAISAAAVKVCLALVSICQAALLPCLIEIIFVKIAFLWRLQFGFLSFTLSAMFAQCLYCSETLALQVLSVQWRTGQ